MRSRVTRRCCGQVIVMAGIGGCAHWTHWLSTNRPVSHGEIMLREVEIFAILMVVVCGLVYGAVTLGDSVKAAQKKRCSEIMTMVHTLRDSVLIVQADNACARNLKAE